MSSKTPNVKDPLTFAYFPQFAQFIIDEKLEEYVHMQISLARELNIPLMQYFSHFSEEELIEYSLKTSREFLQFIADNKAEEQLSNSLIDWKKNQLEFVDQKEIMLDDIFMISITRKKTFVHLLQSYTRDLEKILALADEIDTFIFISDKRVIQTYIELLQERLAEDKYFREKLVETSPGFYYLFDAVNDRQIHTTDKLFRYLGFEEKIFKGNDRFFKSLIHPDDIQSAAEYVNKVKEQNDDEVHFFEYRIRGKNGKYKWMRNYESVYKRNKNNEVSELIGVAFDITDERSITEKLMQHEEELLEAQEIAKIGSYNWDFLNGESTRTKETEKILNLKSDEKFDVVINRIHPADKEMVLKSIKNAVEMNGDLDCEYRYISDSIEKNIWAKGKVVFKNGIAINMKGTVMDITDKYALINKLRDSEELYKQAQAMNKSGNWSWVMDENKFQYSDEMLNIFGLRNHQQPVPYTSFLELLHPEDSEPQAEIFKTHLTDTEPKEYYFRIITPGENEKILYGKSQSIANENGNIIRIIGTCQDVTQQKLLEKTLFNKTVQLERSNESLQEFAYISSHDLKEPLRKIAVFSDKLKTHHRNEMNEESKEIIDRIISSTTRMQRIVDEILSLSRITSDETFAYANPSEIFKEVFESLNTELADGKMKAEIDMLPEIYINEVQFRQLFYNLISNSIKFSRKEESPEVSLKYDYPDEKIIQQLRLNPATKYIRLIYSDNGIGFGQESAQKIFTIFHRLHSRDKYEGTGIGLAICKKIVEHHQGDIAAEGVPGKGATFKIILPLH